MRTNVSAEVPSEFRRLWEFADETMRPTPAAQRSSLHILPTSLRYIADTVEGSEPFAAFVASAFPTLKSKLWRVSETLRRSGFYHAVRNAEEPARVWEALQRRLSPHVVNSRTFFLLDGCWFPMDQFEIAGVTIERMPGDVLRTLGPTEDGASVFFPMEA